VSQQVGRTNVRIRGGEMIPNKKKNTHTHKNLPMRIPGGSLEYEYGRRSAAMLVRVWMLCCFFLCCRCCFLAHCGSLNGPVQSRFRLNVGPGELLYCQSNNHQSRRRSLMPLLSYPIIIGLSRWTEAGVRDFDPTLAKLFVFSARRAKV
jgi:hypothetical protein